MEFRAVFTLSDVSLKFSKEVSDSGNLNKESLTVTQYSTIHLYTSGDANHLEFKYNGKSVGDNYFQAYENYTFNG